jgi:hypothetical protein
MKNQRGLAIISVLFLSLLIIGFIGAAISMAPVALRSSKGFGDQQQASMACEAGIAYAKTRIREDAYWRGSIDAGPVEIASTDDGSVTVFEDHGNVVGLLIAEDGSRAQFRIRFNAQDGTGGADGENDPSPAFRLDSLDFLSYNNLFVMSSQSRQAFSGELLPDVAPREVLLVVEGRAGPALSDLDPQAVNAPPNGRRMVVERLEVSLRPSYDDALDAVIMAGGSITAKLPVFNPQSDEFIRVGSQDALVVPRIRTKQEFNAIGGTRVNYRSQGVVQTASGTVGADTTVSSGTVLGTEGSGEFLELEWDDVKKADPTEPDTVKLRAGTYVLDDGLDLNYYDLGYRDFEQAHANGTLPAPVVLSGDLNEVVENSSSLDKDAVKFYTLGTPHWRVKAVVEFNADVSVSSTIHTDELALVTSQGPVVAQQGNVYPGALDRDATTATPNLGIWLGGHDTEPVTLSAQGDLLLGGVLYGEKGGITTEGDLKTRGTTLLDSSGTQTETGSISTNLYAKGDIEISTFRTVGTPNQGADGKYGHFLSSGVTYAWGDIRITTQEKGVSEAGSFRQRGAMVAYGGDPSFQMPGEEVGSGNISIQARRAKFIYDSSYVGLIAPNLPPDSFRVVSMARR